MPGVGLKSGMLTAFGSDELDADDVDVGRSTCCDFLSSANVSARSSLRVCDGRGHMPCPDHHAVTPTVADTRRWMQPRKINSRLIRAAGAWPRVLSGSTP